MARQRLSEEEIQQALAGLSGWALEHGELVRTWTFADFRQAMAFVNRVAELAEGANHHPDIDIRYNKVRLALTTHDAGGITKNDTEMALRIGKLND